MSSIPVRKTVMLHSFIDESIRKVQILLVESGKSQSYSLATSFLLLAGILEITKPEGISKNTLDFIWKFIDNRATIDNLNFEDLLAILEKRLKEGMEKKNE